MANSKSGQRRSAGGLETMVQCKAAARGTDIGAVSDARGSPIIIAVIGAAIIPGRWHASVESSQRAALAEVASEACSLDRIIISALGTILRTDCPRPVLLRQGINVATDQNSDRGKGRHAKLAFVQREMRHLRTP